MQVPDFKLADQTGEERSLADYRGKYVLLYFYPKDMTSGCTIEAQTFRDMKAEFDAAGIEIIGVSKDDVKSHQKFVEKEGINFTLLADVECELSKAFDVWKEKSMYGRKYMGIQRDSFLIDGEGKVVKHYVKVKPADHPAEVLADVKALSV